MSTNFCEFCGNPTEDPSQEVCESCLAYEAESDYSDDAVLDLFEEDFDPDGYSDEEYRSLTERF